ncbi:lebercilin-like protein [Chironomus tepperi]|uniref:lebercilin-like protein n=1 Tax=Chironomus tepperi TaxID=113505 RepID=UPI00391EF683
MESIYSITPTSSKFSVLSRRKINQKINRDRNPTLVPAVSEIKQRVLSARMLRMKQLQNQIGEAHHRIAELSSENRLLKSLHKRQDSALSKYENSNAELPQLLHSHAEELRMWQTRCRNLQRQNKELQAKMKQKETILLTISDQNKQLLQLNKDKNLQERAGLQERVRILEQRCMDKENEIKLLARRLQLESKAFKSNLTMEQQKYRDLITKIEMSDFLTVTDKKAIPHKAKALYTKSPLNRLASKSAASLSHVSDDKESSAGTTTTLPPCSNEPKKVIDVNKHNNTPSVNSNVKLEIIDASESELDLTKNCIDKSTCLDENDETSNRVKNGMIRARQQHQQPNNKNTLASTKASTKLSPLHTEHPYKSIDNKSEKKSICNDSELSDDDEFQFFSNHNGTKTTHNNARELLEHKMHINELEEKMKQNSLDDNSQNAPHHQCPSLYLPKTSNSSSLSSHDDITLRNEEMTHYTFIDDRGDNELISIQREIRDSTLQRESILDEYCETIFDDDKHSHYSDNTITRVKKIEFTRGAATNNNNGYGHTNGVIGGSYSTAKNQNQSPYQINDYTKSNGHAKTGIESTAGRKEGIGKSTKLDDKKKTRLLAILKNIDGSVDN